MNKQILEELMKKYENISKLLDMTVFIFYLECFANFKVKIMLIPKPK